MNEQRSPEWYKARCGVPTGSRFSEIVTTKGEPSKSRTKYMYQLAAEIISGEPEPSYQSYDMLRGTEIEPEARAVYEMENEVEGIVPGFQLHPSGYYGGSADLLIGDDGMTEIKCPKAATHIEYLKTGKLPTTYFQQVHGYLLIYGRQWCDFFSYYPGLKPFQVRVYPDTEFQKKLHYELVKFCEELKQLIEKVRG
jgi:hypothetical protein